MLKDKTRALLEQASILRKRLASDSRIVTVKGRFQHAKNPAARERQARRAIAQSLRAKRSDPDNEPGAVRAWRRAGGL